MKNNEWYDRAACKEVDPELFFPVGNGDEAAQQAQRASQICRKCDVLHICLQDALKTRQDYGIWGSLDESQRNEILKKYHTDNARVGRTVSDSVNSNYYDNIGLYATKYLEYVQKGWDSDL